MRHVSRFIFCIFAFQQIFEEKNNIPRVLAGGGVHYPEAIHMVVIWPLFSSLAMKYYNIKLV